MPEGVEVKIQVEGLQQVVNERIIGISVGHKGDVVIRPESPFEFHTRLVDSTISGVRRMGKKILFQLEKEDEEKFYVVSFLAMTGRWLIDIPESQIGHTRLEFFLESGKVLAYSDTRVFGTLKLTKFPSADKGFDAIEASPDDISAILAQYSHKTCSIKKLILDQDILCGLGNVYANEALYEAGLFPGKRVNTFAYEDFNNLGFAIREVLDKGYKYGGLSMRDYYHVDGSRGTAQNYLNIYKKESCFRCDSTVIRSEKFDRRTTFYCPSCQL